MSEEHWLPVVDWEGLYEVSDLGRVRSLDRIVHDSLGRCSRHRGRVLRSVREEGQAYSRVTLQGRGHKIKAHVHVLVLTAFQGPRPGSAVGCHRNDVKLDNRLSNLRWDTQSANGHDQVRNGVHPSCDQTACRHGHDFTPENLYINPAGARCCRSCRAAWCLANYRRRTGGVPLNVREYADAYYARLTSSTMRAVG